MKPQHFLLSIPIAVGVDAFTAPSKLTSSFIPSNMIRSSSPVYSTLKIETEAEGSIDNLAAVKTDETILDKVLISLKDQTITQAHDTDTSNIASLTVEEMEATNGMPWSSTIGSSDHPDPLLYMPFWEWQIQHMKENLTNLRADETALSNFGYKDNQDKKARIVNQCYTSDEYRKIRMTYYDAGDNTQVFNSVWYPDPKYNLPVLGIDLLAFNRKKYLAIVDFQPLHANEEDHAVTYEHRLRPIKDQYESLKGRMSSKFYDETQFFSQQMLFARFEDESVVNKDLFPAFKRYVNLHNKLVKQVEGDEAGVEDVLARQRDYDTYSAERDPATGLFAAMFGKEWADNFVFDFLFSMSERKEGGLQIPPMFGGGGPPGGRPQQKH